VILKSNRFIRESFKSRVESLEDEARKARDQVAELTRTANEYSNIILKQEQEVNHLSAERTSDQHKRSQLSKQIHELQARLDASKAEMDAQRSDYLREVDLRGKLQEELDELRALMATKTSEESRRNEVEKSKDIELANLRQQNTVAQKDLAEARSVALEVQGKLGVELDAATREYRILERAHHDLLGREQAASSQASKAEASVAELEKAKRALESDLQSIRTRQLDTEGQLAEALGAKEVCDVQSFESDGYLYWT
jgi:myosin heavy chain 9/10/11/14